MGAINNRKLIYILGGLLLIITAAFGWSLTRGYGEKKEEVREEAAAKQKEPAENACASNATYARLKQVTFEEALKQRTSAPADLDTLAQHSVVRMEDPIVRSRDEDLNVTVCSGRFILELPPGAEVAFGGQRRLVADIEYAAQAAADGSGLVYQIRGAEPIITKLAAFDMRQQQLQMPETAQPATEYAEVAPSPAAPAPDAAQPPAPQARPAPPRAPSPPPAPREAPAPDRRADAPLPPRAPARPPEPRRPETGETAGRTYSNPSFNCRAGRSRSEQMVCSSQSLAARDRAMSSMFYSAMASADPSRRAELRRTRDRFLAYRERCRDEACVADAYEGRMREIRDIMAEAE